jgi:hypothetical protein
VTSHELKRDQGAGSNQQHHDNERSDPACGSEQKPRAQSRGGVIVDVMCPQAIHLRR